MSEDEIVAHHLRLIADYLANNEQPVLSEKYYLRALETNPDDATTLNNFAWLYVTYHIFDTSKYRKLALTYSKNAAKIDDSEDYILGTLACAFMPPTGKLTMQHE